MEMESKEVTALVIMDLSADFDTVYHDILLSVLHNQFGITSNALSWFDTYLHPRQFYVHVEVISHQTNPLTSQSSKEAVVPTLIMAYSSTLQYVIHQDSRIDGMGPDLEPVKCNNPILLNGFVDDHSLNSRFTPDTTQADRNALVSLEICLNDISE